MLESRSDTGRRFEDTQELSQPLDLHRSHPDVDCFEERKGIITPKPLNVGVVKYCGPSIFGSFGIPLSRPFMGMCVSRREHMGVHVSSESDAMCGGFVAEQRDVDDLRHVPRILPMGFG
jgi:hypothetical protein